MNFHEILVNIGGDASGAKRALKDAAVAMGVFGKEKQTAEADVDITEVRTKLTIARAELRRLGRMKVTPEVKLKMGQLVAQIVAYETLLKRANEQTKRNTSSTAAFRRGLSNLIETLKPDSVKIGAFSFSLSRAGFAILAVAGAITKSLLGALAAMAASLTLAIGGLGALAVAALAALGPLLAIGLAAAKRFTDATKAADEAKTAMDNYREATRAQKDAERGLESAQRDAKQAQFALADARRQAAEEARQAIRDEQAAELDLANAQQDVLAAQEAVTQAREDAARALVDLRLAAQGAALSEKQAALDLKDAKDALQAVQADPTASSDQIKRARLEVAQAELQLKAARVDGKRSQEDLADAEKAGINGSDQVVSAQQALVDAQQRATEATVALAAAQREVAQNAKEGIRGDESVVSARRAVADANRQVEDSQRNVARATRETAQAQKELNQANAQAAAVGPGTAGFALTKAITEMKRAFNEITAGGADNIFRGLADALKTLAPSIKVLKDEFTGLGQAVGDAFRFMGREFASPEWQRIFKGLIDLASSIVPVVARGFVGLAKVFAQIAIAAKPFLVDGLNGIVETVGKLGKLTGNSSTLGAAIGVMIDNLKDWIALIGELGGAWIAFSIVAAPAGQEMVRFFTDGARALREFFSSAQGKTDVQDFFADTLPLAMSVLSLIGTLLEVFIAFGQTVAPALKPVIDALNTLLGIIRDVLQGINDLPGPLGTIVGAFLAFGPAVGFLRVIRFLLKPITAGFALLGRVLTGGAISAGLSRLGTGFAGFASLMKGRLLPLLARVGPMFLRFLGPAGLALAATLEWGDDLGRIAADFLGFGDDAIQNATELQNALGHQSDALFEVNKLLQALNKTSVGPDINTKEDLWAAYSKKQVDRMTEILARGGSLAGRKWVTEGARALTEGRDRLYRAAGNSFNAVSEAATAFEPNMKTAGRRLGEAVAAGIRAAARTVKSAMHAVAQGIRDVLPGSEPKDQSSPLRHLDRAGQAAMENFSRGLRQAARGAAGDVKLGFSGVSRAAAGVGGGGGGGRNVTMHNHFQTPGGGSPDPGVAVAQLSRRLRARALEV